MRHRAFLFPLLLALGTSASAAYGAELPQGAAAAPEPPPGVRACPQVGRGFFQLPGQDVCLRIGLDLLYEGKGDTTRDKLNVQTQRLVDTPMALYEVQDVSKTVTRYRSRTSGTISLTAVSAVGDQPLVTHLALRGGIDDTNAADRRAGDGAAIPSTYLDQAWISAYGFTAGLRASLFDFNNGYGYAGSYGSQRRTNAISYEHSVTPEASLGLSVEDNAFRRYEEGVWANYGPQRFPDVVLRGRLSPSWGAVHVATAAHPINDAINGKEALGWAANAGVEVRLPWAELMGENGPPGLGRLMVTGAYAKGALDYLGIPRFNSDYIAETDGSISLSKGYSAAVSYEHIWKPDLKTTATVAGYRTTNGIENFEGDARGALVQAGIEYMPAGNTFLGAEVTYYWDEVQGTYLGVDGDALSTDFMEVYAYLRRRV